MSTPADLHLAFTSRMDCYTHLRRVRRVGPSVCPSLWERLREEIERAGVVGDLSDNERDDLINRWSEETGR